MCSGGKVRLLFRSATKVVAKQMFEYLGVRRGRATLTKKCLFGAIKPPKLPINYPTGKKKKRNCLKVKQLRLILVGSQG